jgi:hypothetical protein
MSAFVEISDELIGAVEMSMSGDRDVAVCALGIVRDGVITGEGPTTRGRIQFSRALDARYAAWCARILTATAVTDEPVSRAEAEALFEITAAAAERSDNGQLVRRSVRQGHRASPGLCVGLAGAVAHHCAVARYRH